MMKLSSKIEHSYICSCCGIEISLAPSTAKRHRVANPEKVCRRCRINKKMEAHRKEYQIDESGRRCKQCLKYKLWSEFPGKHANNTKVVKCNDCVVAGFKTKWKSDPKFTEATRKSTWKSHLRRTYGITIEQYNEMAKRQGGKCAICGTSPQDKLCVDHCHRTKVVRKLLCRNCNKALGIFNDCPDTLRKAVDYLESFQTKP